MIKTENKTPFSAVPGAVDPQDLLIQYQAFLVKSLTVLIFKTAESLKLDLDELHQKVEALDVSRQFNPGIYAFYDQLKEGYFHNDLHALFDSLQALKTSNLYADGLVIGSLVTEEWERVCLPHLRCSYQNASVMMLPLIHWRVEDYPPATLKQALNWIETTDPHLYDEFLTYVARIKLYAGKYLESSTSARSFGALFLRVPHPHEEAPLFYYRNLVHELSHLHLYALSLDDPLVLNDEHERFPSPLRADERPMIGVFHAVFVLSRMVRAFRRLKEHIPQQSSLIDEQLSKQSRYFLDGLETIGQHAQFTEKGKEIFNTLESCAHY